MTQRNEVLDMLRNRAWVCGTEFLDARIPRYSARLNELRSKGFVISDRVCANPQHRYQHRSRQWEWHLVVEPGGYRPFLFDEDLA